KMNAHREVPPSPPKTAEGGSRILQQIPDLAAIKVSMQARVGAQLWFARRDAVPPVTEQGSSHKASCLGQPLPSRQAQPVDQVVRPDPNQPALASNNLSHAFHARPH